MSSGPPDGQKRAWLASLLDVLLEKLKWDEAADVEDADDDDNAEFEKIRKVGKFRSSLLRVDQPPDW